MSVIAWDSQKRATTVDSIPWQDAPMRGLSPWLGVARAPFLLLSFTLVAAGAAAGAYEGAFGWRPTLLALLGLVALHAAVNALNEASDMETGIDLRTQRTPFSGGSGTLPSGALSVRATRLFAYALALLGGLIGGHFALQLGLSFVLLMAVGAAAVLFYSDVLARIGLGELFAGLGLGALPVWGAAWVQGKPPGAAALWAGAPAFFMTFNLLLLNEFPDEEADRAGGRRNLVLIFGRPAAAGIYAAAALLTPVSIVAAVLLKALPPLALAAALPSLLLAKPLGWAFGRPRDPVPVPALGANVVWNLATNTVLAVALALAPR
jgi:1,4-dihydroxy-2-naphthoate octaprenyltransferase